MRKKIQISNYYTCDCSLRTRMAVPLPPLPLLVPQHALPLSAQRPNRSPSLLTRVRPPPQIPTHAPRPRGDELALDPWQRPILHYVVNLVLNCSNTDLFPGT